MSFSDLVRSSLAGACVLLCACHSDHHFTTSAELENVRFPGFYFSPQLLQHAEAVYAESTAQRSLVRMTFCTNLVTAPCEPIWQVVDENGVMVFVTYSKGASTDYHLLRSRPPPVPVHMRSSLVRIQRDQLPNRLDNRDEWYAISRVMTYPKTTLDTTDRKWPIVSCAARDSIRSGCSLGFLFHGSFIEAHFAPRSGKGLNQTEAWTIASSLTDELVRDTIVTGDGV